MMKASSVLLVLMALVAFGCSKDHGQTFPPDATIPENQSWDINTVLDLSQASPYLEPHIAVVHQENRIHIAYFSMNRETETAETFPYRICYRSFNASDLLHLGGANTIDETVVLLEDDGRNIGALSMAMAGGKPVVAYSVYKEYVHVEGADLNNQGDVRVAVRDGAGNWRVETGAFGYVERNPVFVDGLASSDFCVKGDENGNVLLSFQFFYEGIDSYNYDYPDLRYISQPVNGFVDGSVYDVIDLEETVEGNTYQNNQSGQQSYQGGHNDLVLDHEGNAVLFYYNDNSVNGPAQDRGLRVARRVTDGQGGSSWQSRYIESGIDVVDIKGAVTSDGRLLVVYAVQDLPDFIDPGVTLPYVIKYAEQVDVVIGQDEDENDIVERKWQTGFVNYNTICGRFCTLALDSDDQPVVAYFDEMNFTKNRFFSRLKVSRRQPGGAWDVDLIVPEDVGLSNNTSPLDIQPAMHDRYYIGKYNHLWLDSEGRICIASYSTVSRKLYLFVGR